MTIETAKFDVLADEIKKYELLKKEYDEKISNLKAKIKAEMTLAGVDEVKTEKYIIRNKLVTSNRFDTKRFKKEHENLYEAYTVSSTSERFTIN